MRVHLPVDHRWFPFAALALGGFLLPVIVGCAGVRKPSPLPPHAIRPVVAVTSFEDRSGFQGPWRLDRDMADLLITELVWADRFEVVERRELEAVVGELRHQGSELFRPEGKAEIGQLKNARFQIRGSIEEFAQVSGGSWFLGFPRFLVGGSGHTARVSLTLTIVDVESGRIVSSVTGAGDAKAREAFADGNYDDVAFGGKAFFRTPLGHATRDALRRAVVELSEAMPLAVWRPLIAAISDDRIIVNGGAAHGLFRGATYRVREAPRPVTDPLTGDVISWLAGDVVGTIRIESVSFRAAVARAVEGTGFARGQALEGQAQEQEDGK